MPGLRVGDRARCGGAAARRGRRRSGSLILLCRARSRRRRAWTASPELRFQLAEAADQILDPRRRGERAHLDQRDLEQDARRLGAAQQGARLEEKIQHRVEIGGPEFLRLRDVPLPVAGGRVHELLEGGIHGDQKKLAEMVCEPVRDLLDVHAPVVEPVQYL